MPAPILLTPRSIITMDPSRRIIHDGGIIVRGNTIEAVLDKERMQNLRPSDFDVVRADKFIAIPGFIQTHIHLCQTLFRGRADDLELLDWLRLRIFPFEAAHSASSMYASALLGIAELLRSGTTTIMDMGSVQHEDQVVRAISETGLRAFVGKAMMDINDVYPALRESTEDALSSTLHQAEQWHGSANGRLRYAVAPRFVLSCTDALLREAYAMTDSFPGMLFHTHASENRHELDAVIARCGRRNVEHFEALGILRENTCLAHCVWLDEAEVALLAQRKSKVLHCPSSNLKLGSGVANIPRLLGEGITVSLGADGAPCNNTLDMFQEMRLAALLQKPTHGSTAMPASLVFELATLGGARTLGIEKELGSIEAGKKADLVLLDLDRGWNPPLADDLYSAIVYSGRPDNVQAVMVDGSWVCRGGALSTLDEEKVIHTAQQELQLLLRRMH